MTDSGTAENEVTMDKLVRDFKVVIHDAEGLLKASAGELGEKAREARVRLSAVLKAPRPVFIKSKKRPSLAPKPPTGSFASIPINLLGSRLALASSSGCWFPADSMADQEQSPGILGSLRRVADTALGSVHNRIELFAVELQEEKAWLISTLIWVAASIFFCGLAIIFVVGTAVYLVSDAVRPWLLGGFSAVFLIVAGYAVTGFVRSLRDKARPMADTLRELKKDIEWIRSQD